MLQRAGHFELGFDLRLRHLQRRILVGELAGALGNGGLEKVRLQFQETQQPQEAQRPQPARVKADRKRRRDRQQIHDARQAEHVRKPVLRGHDAQHVLEREHRDDDDLLDAQRACCPGRQPRDRRQPDGGDAHDDQHDDEVLEGLCVRPAPHDQHIRQGAQRSRCDVRHGRARCGAHRHLVVVVRGAMLQFVRVVLHGHDRTRQSRRRAIDPGPRARIPVDERAGLRRRLVRLSEAVCHDRAAKSMTDSRKISKNLRPENRWVGDFRSPRVGAWCPGTAAPCGSAMRLERLP